MNTTISLPRWQERLLHNAKITREQALAVETHWHNNAQKKPGVAWLRYVHILLVIATIAGFTAAMYGKALPLRNIATLYVWFYIIGATLGRLIMATGAITTSVERDTLSVAAISFLQKRNIVHWLQRALQVIAALAMAAAGSIKTAACYLIALGIAVLVRFVVKANYEARLEAACRRLTQKAETAKPVFASTT